MADRQRSPGPVSRHVTPAPATAGGLPTIRQRLIDQMPNSAQLVGFLTLLISGGILLLLTGSTLTAGLLGVIFFAPLVLLTVPVWFPLGAVLFAATFGFLTTCGFGVAAVAGATWMYRYVRGRRPVGSGGVDYARSRIADTASQVKDYAREYGGYLQSRVKDAAPGA